MECRNLINPLTHFRNAFLVTGAQLIQGSVFAQKRICVMFQNPLQMSMHLNQRDDFKTEALCICRDSFHGVFCEQRGAGTVPGIPRHTAVVFRKQTVEPAFPEPFQPLEQLLFRWNNPFKIQMQRTHVFLPYDSESLFSLPSRCIRQIS